MQGQGRLRLDLIRALRVSRELRPSPSCPRTLILLTAAAAPLVQTPQGGQTQFSGPGTPAALSLFLSLRLHRCLQTTPSESLARARRREGPPHPHGGLGAAASLTARELSVVLEAALTLVRRKGGGLVQHAAAQVGS